MNLIILTGMSGSGKSKAINILEDIGYFCIDNLPPALISKFADLTKMEEMDNVKFAIVVDVRSKDMFQYFEEELDILKKKNTEYRLVYMDASDRVITNRYEETRRKHPLLDEKLTLEASIREERERLYPIKKKADYIFDTDELSVSDLRKKLTGFFGGQAGKAMKINCVSFGFKYGAPSNVDLQYDVRCLINPFYIPELKHKTGLDKEVADYVMNDDISKDFWEKISDFLDFSVPLYIKEGKSQLTIGFGCTGGKHRSVTFAEKAAKHLAEQGYSTVVTHRDIEK